MYFYLHIISLLIILFLPIKPQAHNQRWPQTLNSVNKKMDWYLHQKKKKNRWTLKTANHWTDKIKTPEFSSDLEAMFTCIFFLFLFFKCREYFYKAFLYHWISHAQLISYFIGHFSGMEVCGESARTCRDNAFWASGSLFFWHDLQPLKSEYWEPECLLPKWEGEAEMTCLPEYTQDGCASGSPQSFDLWHYCSQTH